MFTYAVLAQTLISIAIPLVMQGEELNIDYFRNFMGSVEKCLRDRGVDKPLTTPFAASFDARDFCSSSPSTAGRDGGGVDAASK